jgi:tRNA threonylcarbamoyladenosine biosynthesis protein TsaB
VLVNPPPIARVIAIDTSHPTGSVAAYNPRHEALPRQTGGIPAATIDDAVFSETFDTPADHARLLAGGIERTCRLAGWLPREVDLVGVVVGPGSFTGLRVGVTAAKVLAWATGCKLVGVSAFDLLAHCCGRWALRAWPETVQLELALNAGRGEVHATSAIRSEAATTGWEVTTSRLLSRTAWIDALPPQGIVVTPTACDALRARGDLRFPPGEMPRTTAADTAMLAVRLAAVGVLADPASLTPEYLRPSYAEEPRRR